MRPSIDETWLTVALALARRGTCFKMQVGCVLTDSRGRFLAGNYNGVAAGRPHCNESKEEGRDFVKFGKYVPGHGQPMRPTRFETVFPHKCAGADAPPGSDLCEAVHAEQNALTWCRDPDAVRVCYTTISPCMRCVKQLLNTGCERIVFPSEYTREPQAAALWRGAGRAWELVDDEMRARLRCVEDRLDAPRATRQN